MRPWPQSQVSDHIRQSVPILQQGVRGSSPPSSTWANVRGTPLTVVRPYKGRLTLPGSRSGRTAWPGGGPSDWTVTTWPYHAGLSTRLSSGPSARARCMVVPWSLLLARTAACSGAAPGLARARIGAVAPSTATTPAWSTWSGRPPRPARTTATGIPKTPTCRIGALRPVVACLPGWANPASMENRPGCHRAS
jgi:hypothetical protein